MAEEPEVPEDEDDDDVAPYIAPERKDKFTISLKAIRLLDDDGNEISMEEFKKLHKETDDGQGPEED